MDIRSTGINFLIKMWVWHVLKLDSNANEISLVLIYLI